MDESLRTVAIIVHMGISVGFIHDGKLFTIEKDTTVSMNFH